MKKFVEEAKVEFENQQCPVVRKVDLRENHDFTLDSREFQNHARFTWILKIRVIHVNLKSR